MEQLREFLARRVGPFTVGTWLIVGGAGIGLGLAARRVFGKADDPSGDPDFSGSAAVAEPQTPIVHSGGGLSVLPGRVGAVGATPSIPIGQSEQATELQSSLTRIGDLLENRLEPIPVAVPADPDPVPDPVDETTSTPTPTNGDSAPDPTPTQTGTTYTVKRGDTLSAIGRKFGVPWRDIFNANRDKIDDPDLIFPGQVFVIPGV